MHCFLLLRARNGHRNPVSCRLAMSTAICRPHIVLRRILLLCRLVVTVVVPCR